MATVRTATNEVEVDSIIYTFSDAEVADLFEACVATTGDVAHCIKGQLVLNRREVEAGNALGTELASLEPGRDQRSEFGRVPPAG
jgi:hypothetical protein